MARIDRRFVVGAVSVVLGIHTMVLGVFLLFLGSQQVFVFGALTAGTGVLFVGGGLWRTVSAWGAGDDGSTDGDRNDGGR